ncbi:methionyl-tRNA formyltransferase, mitochondrial isoform X2 [Cylas formicarius]|uniref:methionyl-tRNA formyltransferase, mitochondrial isoform X2 n=1 Tax=Cylas formicarius TaxID=197179 RepID=UPI002958A0C6|nr:methionyl-tRNA formyltransferase, mitochondrial isoform X2 [Cylas formicarius]
MVYRSMLLLIFNKCRSESNRFRRSFSRFSPLNSNALDIKKPPYKVLFFGTDDFSLHSLGALLKERERSDEILTSLDVVTNSERSQVGKYSLARKIRVFLWPPSFEVNEYDVGLVVSFGRLIPSCVIDKFPLGMLNVHGSLLPRWRGASPVIHCLAEGDTETGISIMGIEPEHFDTGPILLQKKIDIPPTTIMPDLRYRLGKLGAECLIETLRDLPGKLANAKPQPTEGVCYAPKITARFARIDWDLMTAARIYNLERAVKFLYPLTTTWNSLPVRLFDVEVLDWRTTSNRPGYISYHRNRRCVVVECAQKTWISVKYVAVAQKKPIRATDFRNAYVKRTPDPEIGKMFK